MKKLIKTALAVSFVFFMGISVYNTQILKKASVLSLDNIEALAGGEVSVTGCYPGGGTCVITIGGVHIVKNNQHP